MERSEVFVVGRGGGARETNRLLEGNLRFVDERIREDPEAFSKHRRGQKPPFLFVGCCDSRKPLDLLTRTLPGELFIHRNIANLLPEGDPASGAVLEYAMSVLEVRHLIVSGHTRCGGVEAAIQGFDEGEVGRWIAPIRDLARERREALEGVEGEEARTDALARMNVIAQVENALQHPAVRRRLEGEGPPIHLHGWIYRVETGRLEELPLPARRWRAEGLLPPAPQ